MSLDQIPRNALTCKIRARFEGKTI